MKREVLSNRVLDGYQYVRVLDVFLLAPVMIYASQYGKNLPDFVRLVLLVSGICTFVFNGKNYIDIERNK